MMKDLVKIITLLFNIRIKQELQKEIDALNTVKFKLQQDIR